MKKILWLMLILALVISIPIACNDDDDDDDDDRDDDDDDGEAPDTYIVTSGYGNPYYVFNGDTYELVGSYEPMADGMNSLQFATLIPSAMGPMAVFSAKPAAGGHAELFYADSMTDNDPTQMTSLESEGLTDTSPDYNQGVVFVGVKTLAGHPEVLHMPPGSTDPDVYKSGTYQKMIGGDLCESRRWMSPKFSPSGEYFASGWLCKDETGEELPSWTTILAFNSDEEECGDPLYEVQGDAGVQDVCFTSDSSMVLFSIGVGAVNLDVYAAKTDGSEDPVDITASFNGGDILNFDCDPTSPRIVYNDLGTNPNIFVMEYEVSDDGITFEAATQITEDSTFRRPRWIENPD